MHNDSVALSLGSGSGLGLATSSPAGSEVLPSADDMHRGVKGRRLLSRVKLFRIAFDKGKDISREGL